MISNEVTEWIYNVYRHRITEWNHFIMSPDQLQIYSEAIHDKGAALDNCFGFVDGTVRPISKPGVNQRVVIMDTNEFTLLNSNVWHYQMGWSAICLDQWVRFISKYALSIEVFYHSCFCCREKKTKQQKFKTKKFLLCKDCLNTRWNTLILAMIVLQYVTY